MTRVGAAAPPPRRWTAARAVVASVALVAVVAWPSACDSIASVVVAARSELAGALADTQRPVATTHAGGSVGATLSNVPGRQAVSVSRVTSIATFRTKPQPRTAFAALSLACIAAYFSARVVARRRGAVDLPIRRIARSRGPDPSRAPPTFLSTHAGRHPAPRSERARAWRGQELGGFRCLIPLAWQVTL